MHMKNPPTGKILVRGPKWLHEHLKNEADQTGLSLNELCVKKLEARIELPPQHPIPVNLLKKLVTEWSDFLIGIIHYFDENSKEKVALLIKKTHGHPNFLRMLWYKISADYNRLAFDPPVFIFETTLEKPWIEILVSGNIVWDKDRQTLQQLRTHRFILANSYKTLRASQQSAAENTSQHIP
jgi:hypothetical protein